MPDKLVIDWDHLPDGLKLGVDSDLAIGRAVGCSQWTVREERLRRARKKKDEGKPPRLSLEQRRAQIIDEAIRNGYGTAYAELQSSMGMWG